MSADRLYRPCVGIMLFNSDNLVLIAQRIDSPGEAWQMPQGGIDEGEKPVDAAFRELEEEIGTASALIIAEMEEWLPYDLPQHLAKSLWGGRYVGQIQKWFAMRLLAHDSEINLNTAKPEFNEWKWIALEGLVNVAVPFKRAIYAKLVTCLGRKICQNKL